RPLRGLGFFREPDPRATLAALAHPGLLSVVATRLVELIDHYESRKMVQDFAGRVVLITGAGRGLGRATAERFLERGAQVAVNVRTPERAETLAHELSRNTHPVPGDIRSAPVVRVLVVDIVKRFGRLDILVNNAAIA